MIEQGEISDAFYIVRDGEVVVSRKEAGEMMRVGKHGYFGERALPASLFPAPVVGFMCEQLQRAMKEDDPDLVGELLDPNAQWLRDRKERLATSAPLAVRAPVRTLVAPILALVAPPNPGGPS